LKIAFFDTKPYDKEFFDMYGRQHGAKHRGYDKRRSVPKRIVFPRRKRSGLQGRQMLLRSKI